jgi:hypothetical protein
VLRQVQRTVHFLQHSELSSFDGVDLMEACRDIGMHKVLLPAVPSSTFPAVVIFLLMLSWYFPQAIELQNDASEFFQRILERLEAETHPRHLPPLQRAFRVRMLTQRRSAECAHRKPAAEGPFDKALNLAVAGMRSLEASLADLVKVRAPACPGIACPPPPSFVLIGHAASFTPY